MSLLVINEAEVIMQSAERRLDEALASFRRATGVVHDLMTVPEWRMRREAEFMKDREDPPEIPRSRKKLKRNWAWWIRLRGRMG